MRVLCREVDRDGVAGEREGGAVGVLERAVVDLRADVVQVDGEGGPRGMPRRRRRNTGEAERAASKTMKNASVFWPLKECASERAATRKLASSSPRLRGRSDIAQRKHWVLGR